MESRRSHIFQLSVVAVALLAAASLLAISVQPRVVETSAEPITVSAPAELTSLATTMFPPSAVAVAAPTGDGVGMVDPTQGLWHLRNRAGDPTVFYYGNPGDFPIVGDWDCNGVATPGMYRQADGYVYLRNSNSQGVADIRFFFGNPGDIPIVGDFNGDGCDTVSIYRPSQGRAFIINELGANEGGLGEAEFSYFFGNPGDKPFVGDFNGNGTATVGLHRESTGFVYFRNTHTQGVADNEFFFGDPDDRLVAGDWTGNGTDSPGLFRPSNLTVYLRYTNTQGNADESYTWGQTPWIPVAGDFGTLSSGVNVNITGASQGLAYAVESLYLELPSAPHLPPGLRGNLAGLSDRNKSQAVTGNASTATAYGKQVAVVTSGSDVILAVSDNGWEWRVVGTHMASYGKVRWYGGSPRFVAIIGTDFQPSGSGLPEDPFFTNADSVHIVSLVPEAGAGAIVGIPRDTVVRAPYGQDKIAITSRDRGVPVTVEALRTETNLPIEGFFHTGFGTSQGTPPGYTDLVDAYGGLPFLVPYDAGFVQEGDTFVDGPEALRFARERKTLPHGDVDRSLGQGLLLKAAIADVKPLGIHAMPDLLAIMDDYVTTDLDAGRILTLAATLYDLDPGPMPTVTAQSIASLGWWEAFDQNHGSIPNVVVRGCFGVFEGDGSNGFFFNPQNRETFADLADGILETMPIYRC